MLHEKNGKAIQVHRLKGYNRPLEMQILRTVLETYSLLSPAGRLSNPDKMRRRFKKLANLKALRSPDFVSALDKKLGLCQ